MATRRVILLIGDETVTGRPIAELTAINASYDDPQTDMVVWNIQSAAWETLTPGTNSNTVTAASDLASVESFLRAGLRTQFPTETLYLIKWAGAGSVRDWSPDGGANLAAMIAQVTAAAVAANAAGDSLSIDAIVCSIQKEDHRLDTWRSYGASLEDLLFNLREDLDALPYVSLGTVRDDGGITPVCVLPPHHDYDVSDYRLVHCRMQAEILENPDDRTRVVRKSALIAEANGSYSAISVSMLGSAAAAHLFAASFDDGNNPAGNLVLCTGDSTAEGSFTTLSSLPAHQQAALTGANIWNPTAGKFQTLTPGIFGNNLISWPQVLAYYGIEIGLCDKLRDSFNVYYVKGTQISSRASDNRGRLDTGGIPPPPHGDFKMASWAPGKGNLSDLCIHGWFLNAVQALRDSNLKPVLRLAIISVGLNDTAYTSTGSDPNAVAASIESQVARVKKLCADHSVDTSSLRFIVLVPPTYAVDGVAPFDNTEQAELDIVRNDLLALPDTHQDISVIDLSDFGSNDNYHQNSAGTAELVDKIYATFVSGQPDAVYPMFVPTMTHLKKALRLSGVPDTNDALAMIDSADQMAKARFYRALGQDRIAAIQAISYSTNPRTQNEHLRNLAVETEIKIVRLELMRTLPLMFKDGASVVQAWQEEGAFREGGYLQTEAEIKRLNSEIETNLEMLRNMKIVDASGLSIEAVVDQDNDRPGDSVFKVI